mgnify:CR=1 FL=1
MRGRVGLRAAGLRAELAERVPFSTLELVTEAHAKDGTVKALFRTHDGHPVEAEFAQLYTAIPRVVFSDSLTSVAPGIVDGVDGEPGDRLPGVPEDQASFYAAYHRPLRNGFAINAGYGLTYSGNVITKVGLRNLENMFRQFSCDLLRFSSNPDSVRKIARFMRAMLMTMPPVTGKAPPLRPVPEPRATKRIFSLWQMRRTACTCSVDVGNTTASGMTRKLVSASFSYVRSSSCVDTRPCGPTAARNWERISEVTT